jgi:hypothetical protein
MPAIMAATNPKTVGSPVTIAATAVVAGELLTLQPDGRLAHRTGEDLQEFVTDRLGFLRAHTAPLSFRHVGRTYLHLTSAEAEFGSAAHEIVAQLTAGDHRVRLIRTSGIGRGPALNLALRHARASLIANTDADDVSHPSRLSAQLGLARKHPEFAVLATRAVHVYEAAEVRWPVDAWVT